MQNFLYDFLPVLLFFLAFKIYGIYVATVVGILATAIQVLLTITLRKKIDKQQIVTLGVFCVFGGLTLYFHNPMFVKWKPSVIFWLFGIIFLLSQFIGQKPIIQRMMEKLIEDKATLPRMVWTKMNIAWTIFFLTLGTINIFVAYNFSTDAWVNFKFYGILGMLLLFSFFQALYLSKHLSDENKCQ